jgi:hypothetical protein
VPRCGFVLIRSFFCGAGVDLQRTVAKVLLPTLKQEIEHMRSPDVIRRPRESDVRATCGERLVPPCFRRRTRVLIPPRLSLLSQSRKKFQNLKNQTCPGG